MMKIFKRFYIFMIISLLLPIIGCSNGEKMSKDVYGTYSFKGDNLMYYEISFFSDYRLCFDNKMNFINGVFGSFIKDGEDTYRLFLNEQEYVIELDRRDMTFHFPIEYEGVTYIAEFKKVTNVPYIVDYSSLENK